MRIQREPTFRIWVDGKPYSSQRRNKKALQKYIEHINNSAKQVVQHPITSNRIDIEIWFQTVTSLRADVDNIIKPILDGLKGVVYLDDNQVRSVKATALPSDDVYTINEWTNAKVIERLTIHPPKEFLINVFHGIGISGSPGI